MQPSEGSKGEQGQDTERAGRRHSQNRQSDLEKCFGHELQESEKESAGAAVHYAFGTLSGGLYGALAEVTPQVTTAAVAVRRWLLATRR